ncbi:MAG: 16S rRNA (uracil(1498)-N(3))-methyltransferase [Deltaproteobacteria bacterium]|nr:16S rRNA (uracil(1498)-N(3))-methyltransferase [Deltaproteobacteria bacterium]
MSERVRVEPSALSGSATALSVDGDRGHTPRLRVTRVRSATGSSPSTVTAEAPRRSSRVGRGEVPALLDGPAATGGGADQGRRVRWIQGLPKGEQMDLIVRQATELGVASIAPVFRRGQRSRASSPERWAAAAARGAHRRGGQPPVRRGPGRPGDRGAAPLAALCAAPRRAAWCG